MSAIVTYPVTDPQVADTEFLTEQKLLQETISGGGGGGGGGDVVASGILANNAITLGGGGHTVKTTATGTGIVTALGVNIGSAGAPVINGGALGTPSSGVATNLTGTAAGLTAGTVMTNANLTGPVTSAGNATAIADAALSIAKTSGLQTALDAKAPLASPTLTGTPLAPTAAFTTNTTQIASTAFVQAALAKQAEAIMVAVSDETTALTTGTAKVTFRMPFAMTLTAVRSNINTVSSSGIVTVDINEAGSTILSTKLTIDVGELTSVTAVVPPVISDVNLADDAEMTVDIDVAGTGAKGLKIALIGTRA
jgi:hypothetical protein